MKKIIVVVGLPGCGKSTYIEKMKTDEIVILCADDIRKELLGDEADQSQNAHIFEVFFERLYKLMEEGRDVVIDNASSVEARRRKVYVDAAKKYGYFAEALVINTSIEDCLINNNARERKVPEYVIERYSKMFEAPTVEEGFELITTVDFKRETCEKTKKRVSD